MTPGTYFFPTSDAGALVDPAEETITLELMIERHRGRLQKLSEDRIHLPREEPFSRDTTPGASMSPARCSSSRSQISRSRRSRDFVSSTERLHIYDDVNNRKIPGMEQFGGMVDIEEPFPLTFIDQYMLSEAVAELATSCYAGVLTLQAMASAVGCSTAWTGSRCWARRRSRRAGARFSLRHRRALAASQPHGSRGMFEAMCPAHYPDMAAAVEAFAERRFG
jgi:hypothetical protein